jgi:hypothetical protein
MHSSCVCYRFLVVDLYRKRLGIDSLRIAAGAHARIESIDGRDFIAGQCKIEDVDILSDPFRPHRFRDRREAMIDMPTKHDLSRGLTVLRRQFDDGGVLKRALRRGWGCLRVSIVDAADRRPALRGDAKTC